MTPVLWGALSGLCFGCSDFLTRIVGRAIGPSNALFGTLSTGALGMTIWVVIEGSPVIWNGTGAVWLAASGLAFMVGTLFLYMAYARGPISVAAPLVASFPVFILIWVLVLGIPPTLLQWLGMAVTMTGVMIVARTGRLTAAAEPTGSQGHPLTVTYALVASIILATAIMAARESSIYYGELHTLWLTRVIGTAVLVLYLMVTRTPLRIPLRWWPVLTFQGMLISVGFLVLFIGAAGEGAALAAVAAAPAAVVTALLARSFLREPIPAAQWMGIVVVIIGVAVLGYFG